MKLKSWGRASEQLDRCRKQAMEEKGIYAKELELGIGGGEGGSRRQQSLTGSDATSRAMRSATSTACREPAHATFIASTSKPAAALSAAWWSTSAAAASMAISVEVKTKTKSSEMPGRGLRRPPTPQLLLVLVASLDLTRWTRSARLKTGTDYCCSDFLKKTPISQSRSTVWAT